jgi:uncharacterized membrane protein YgcG
MALLVHSALAQTFPDWNPQVQTWDAVALLSPQSRAHIAQVQKSLREKHKVGLWVVLVDSQKRFTDTPLSIESFAIALARQKVRPLAGNDDYILLLVCKDDRRSRIELGPGWDRQWDDGARLIMDQALVSNFKRGEFDGGVVAAVDALGQMVEARKEPPAWNEAFGLSTRLGSQIGAYSWLPVAWIVPVLILGLLLLLLGMVFTKSRTALAGTGMLLMALALFSQVVGFLALGWMLLWLLSRSNSGQSFSTWSDSGSSSLFESGSSGFFSGASSWSSSDSGSSYSSSDSSWSSSSYSSSDSSWSSSDSSFSSSDWGSGGGATGSW